LRRTILQSGVRFFNDALVFITYLVNYQLSTVNLLVSKHNSALCQVVGTHLYLDLVAGKDLDVVHAHLTRDMGDDGHSVLQLYAEHGVGQCLYDSSVLLDSSLLCHFKVSILFAFYAFRLLKGGEYLCLALADADGVLEVGSRLSILCADSPAVLVHPDIATTHGYHRFDGDAHGGLEHHSVATAPVVGHLRVFVHLAADAVSAQFADDAVALGFAVRLHSVADVTQMATGDCCLDAFIQAFLRGAQQLFDLVANLADAERVGGVAAKAVEQRAAVDGNDVTVLQYRLRIGDTMYDDVVHRGADAGGKRPSIGIGETLESRNGSVITDERIGYLIQLEGRYARLDMLC